MAPIQAWPFPVVLMAKCQCMMIKDTDTTVWQGYSLGRLIHFAGNRTAFSSVSTRSQGEVYIPRLVVYMYIPIQYIHRYITHALKQAL